MESELFYFLTLRIPGRICQVETAMGKVKVRMVSPVMTQTFKKMTKNRIPQTISDVTPFKKYGMPMEFNLVVILQIAVEGKVWTF